MSTPEVSVIILVKNGMPFIERCLEGVFRQKTPWPFEVLVIDSGSSDGTLDVVRGFPTRLIEIPPESFNHGDTRNLGAREARGAYLVYLVADAIPYDENWLAALVSAMQQPDVAGAYSRQIPHPEHDVLVRWSVTQWPTFRTERRVQAYPQNWHQISAEERYWLALFDDVSSCMRKDVWEQFSYHNVHCEDVEWSNRVLAAGYKIVFEPASVVYHSHQRSQRYEFKRAYVFNRQLRRIFGWNPVPRFSIALRRWLWSTKIQWDVVLNSNESFVEKTRLFFRAPIYSSMVFAQYLGVHSDEWLDKYPWFRRIDQVLTGGTQ